MRFAPVRHYGQSVCLRGCILWPRPRVFRARAQCAAMFCEHLVMFLKYFPECSCARAGTSARGWRLIVVGGRPAHCATLGAGGLDHVCIDLRLRLLGWKDGGNTASSIRLLTVARCKHIAC